MVLAILERQGYRCALTGRPLTPDDAVLDHVVPLGRGGEHALANAQVVCRDANSAKRSLTGDEFLALCRDVVAHSERAPSMAAPGGPQQEMWPSAG